MTFEEIKMAIQNKKPVYYQDRNHVVISKRTNDGERNYFILSLVDGSMLPLVDKETMHLTGAPSDYSCVTFTVEILYDVDTAEAKVEQLFQENNIVASPDVIRELAREGTNACFFDNDITEPLYEKCTKKLVQVLRSYGYDVDE